MEKITKPFHYRDILIVLAFIITFFILGSFYDLKISNALYDAVSTNMFGVVMSGVAEWPIYFTIVFSGALLILSTLKCKKSIKIISIIVGSFAIIAGSILAFETFQNISNFQITEQYESLIKYLGLALVLVITGLIVFFTLTKLNKLDSKVTLHISITLLLIIGFELITFTFFKYLWSRPRPYYLVLEPTASFSSWWQLNPFFALSQDHSSYFTSFPSGHTATAMVMSILLPLLTLLCPKTKDNDKLRVILFYVGYGWALITALSRIYAGAHFLSDTAAGMLSTLIIYTVICKIMFHPNNKLYKYMGGQVNE